jgi:small-conductance mechanosensitive channel
MSEPAPAAYFLGFGDSALNFELRFWAAGQDTWFQLKSDVAILVAHALREAGIEIPFPQRDLHLRSIDSSLRSELAAGSDVLAGPKPANGNAAKTPGVDEEQSLR